MKSRFKNAFTVAELLISVGVLIIAIMVTLPAVSLTRPPSVAVKYVAMYVKLQETALKLIADPDYEEHYSPYAFASVNGNDFCEHIAQHFDTKGKISCDGEGSSLSPNFYLTNHTSMWGLGGKDFIVPDGNILEECSDTSKGYNCYKVIYVDLNGSSGLNSIGTDIFKLRLRFDGKVDTLSSWNTENIFLESL